MGTGILKPILKVLVSFGTRPEAIKLMPVIRELQKRPQRFVTRMLVTAQHREMLDQVLNLFNICPDIDMDLMQNDQGVAEFMSRAIQPLDEVMRSECPDIVLVQGDTTTVLVTSLVAFWQKIPIGHIEAGLRTDDKFNPFPEEINRRLTSHIADLHFAPTETARANLIAEGIAEEHIFVTGNTVIDALHSIVDKNYQFENPILREMDFYHKRVILLTAHRRENFGQPLRQICQAVREIVSLYTDVEVVFPMHLNPRVQTVVKPLLTECDRIHLISALSYIEFVQLMSRCYLILTDSGGIQEEAPALGVPVLVLRDKTERPEALEASVAKLVGTSPSRIFDETASLLDHEVSYDGMARATNPFGDGRASQRIANILAQLALHPLGK